MEFKKILIKENYLFCHENHPQSLINHKTIQINVTICGKTYKALIDTGASVNIIYKNVIDDCGISDLIDVENVYQIHGIHGLTSTIGTIWSLDVEYNNHVIPDMFFVMEKQNEYDLILGLPCLFANGIVINFNRQTITIGDAEVKFNN